MKLKKIILENWIIIAILVIATLLRFYRLHDLTTFSGDQGYDFLKVKEILEGNLTLLGPKIGPYNQLGNLYLGPAYYYLLAPALFLFRLDPIGSAVLTAVLSIGTIYVIYLIGINFFFKKYCSSISSSICYQSFFNKSVKSSFQSSPHTIFLIYSSLCNDAYLGKKKKTNHQAAPFRIFARNYFPITLLSHITRYRRVNYFALLKELSQYYPCDSSIFTCRITSDYIRIKTRFFRN